MYINIHTHKVDISANWYILNFYPQNELVEHKKGELLSCGIHPWHVNNIEVQRMLERIDTYALSKKIVAIGECGLDSYRKDMDLQHYVFKKQIDISEKCNIPILIHSVKQHHEILRLHKINACSQPWIVHGFRGKYDLFKQFKKQNIFVSLGPSFFKDIKNARLFFQKADLNFIFFETDDTEISIKELYDFVEKNAIIPNVNWKEIIEDNFKRIF